MALATTTSLGQGGTAERVGAYSAVVVGMAARVADEGLWWRWQRQVERTGFCSHPVRVRGWAAAVDVISGEVRAEWSSAGEPDGSLLLACKDRRVAVCASCAETYRADTWHLIAAGLRGRAVAAERPGTRGGVSLAVPGSVAGHPVVLATFTAPSFGRVHRVSEAVCRARRGRVVCRHGRPVGCNTRHEVGDPAVGQPLCFDCYDYAGHVLWHSAVPELWRRTGIYAYRALARLLTERGGARVTVRSVRESYRISYVKVAEFQKRGAVHLHVIARLDGVDADDPERVVPPPAGSDAGLLEAALREAAGRVAVALPEVGSRSRQARWGDQLDVSLIGDPMRAAAYLAKYATKTAGDVLAGLPARRFGVESLARVRRRGASPHVLLLATTCFKLARRAGCAGLRLTEHVHTLGFRGHFSTRSRRYSITLGALRAARRAWRSTHPDDSPGVDGIDSGAAVGGRADPWAAASNGDGGGTALVSDWRYVGSGFAKPGDVMLAETMARDYAAYREIKREEAYEAWQLADLADVETTFGSGTEVI